MLPMKLTHRPLSLSTLCISPPDVGHIRVRRVDHRDTPYHRTPPIAEVARRKRHLLALPAVLDLVLDRPAALASRAEALAHPGRTDARRLLFFFTFLLNFLILPLDPPYKKRIS